MSQSTVLDESLVEALITDAYREIRARVRYKGEVHTPLQRAIADLSGNFALRPIKEYVLPQFRGDKEGHIDVVWVSGSTPVVAFEIDSRYRAKSLRKLLAVDADLRFWVYYGSDGFEPRVREIDPTGVIHIIRLPKRLPKLDGRATSTIKNNESTTGGPAEIRRDASSKGFASIRAKYPKAYERWSSEEDNLLRKQFLEDVGINELAKRFQRKPGAIRSRLGKLGLR